MGTREMRRARVVAEAVGVVMEGVEVVMEGVEGRVMLSGVTIITHGGLATDVAPNLPPWVDEMANSIAARMPAPPVQYNLDFAYSAAGGFSHRFSRVSEVDLGTMGNQYDIVIRVNWSSFSGAGDYGSVPIGNELADALREAMPGTLHPFAELPLHFIGHSRGVYVNNAAIQSLGEDGVWVDHNTTLDGQLDPLVVNGEGNFENWSNIRFADNHFQTHGNPIASGFSVSGADEWRLNGRTGFDGTTNDHSRVHTWYLGTANLWAEKDSSDLSIYRNEWYGTDKGEQPTLGFHYTQYGGGVRPLVGLKFAGAPRTALPVTLPNSIAWDDVEIVNLLQPSTFEQGSDISVHAQFEDLDKTATITVALDADTNPYNGYLNAQDYKTSGLENNFLSNGRISTNGIAEGGYHVVARISGTHTRYIYAGGTVGIRAAVPVDTIPPTATLSFPNNGGSVSQSLINSPIPQKYLDVTFADASGLDTSSILDSGTTGQEFTLSGAGKGTVIVNPVPTLRSGTRYRYTFTGDFAVGPVTLTFPAGAFKDAVGNANVQFTQNFTVTSGQATLVGLAVSGPASVEENSTGSYTATATFSDGTTAAITPIWSDNSAATTVSNNGVLSAGEVSADTSVTVSASYTLDGVTKTASTAVTILNKGSGPTTDVQLITNGGFESGATGWQMTGGIVAANSFPHTGSKYVVMGEINNAIDTVYQTITIPANATAATLSYWYNITSAQTTTSTVDQFLALIRDANGNNPYLVDGRSNLDKDPGGGNPYYHQKTFDLAPWKGQTIQVAFRSVMDSSVLTSFKLDDVSVVAKIPVPPTLSSLLISGPTSVKENSGARFSATAVYSDGTSRTVSPSWSTNSGVVSINSSGDLSAGSVNVDTNVDILASYTEDGVTRIAVRTVSILNVQAAQVGLLIDGPPSVDENGSAQYVATAVFSDGSRQTVTPVWSVSPSTHASVSPAGLLSAGNVSEDEVVRVSASYGGFGDEYDVVIRDAPTIHGMSATPYSLPPGATLRIDYDVSTSAGREVLVGATLFSLSGGTTIRDAAHDSKVLLPAGRSVHSRQFTVPAATSVGDYNVSLDLWEDTDGNGVIGGSDRLLTNVGTFVKVSYNPRPVITSFTASPDLVTLHGTLTLTATASDGGSIASVSFFRESNGIPGLQVYGGGGGDTWLSNDFAIPYSITIGTDDLTSGTYTYYATALDNEDATSDVAAVTNTFRALLPGDANVDGRVNFADLLILAKNYNRPRGATWETGDFNGDGKVNFADLLTLARNYNTSIATQTAKLESSLASTRTSSSTRKANVSKPKPAVKPSAPAPGRVAVFGAQRIKPRNEVKSVLV